MNETKGRISLIPMIQQYIHQLSSKFEDSSLKTVTQVILNKKCQIKGKTRKCVCKTLCPPTICLTLKGNGL